MKLKILKMYYIIIIQKIDSVREDIVSRKKDISFLSNKINKQNKKKEELQNAIKDLKNKILEMKDKVNNMHYEDTKEESEDTINVINNLLQCKKLKGYITHLISPARTRGGSKSVKVYIYNQQVVEDKRKTKLSDYYTQQKFKELKHSTEEKEKKLEKLERDIRLIKQYGGCTDIEQIPSKYKMIQDKNMGQFLYYYIIQCN